MSLIDEALKRARQEAARQDAAQRYAYPATPVQVPLRDRSRSSLLVGLVAGLLIGVVAIAGTLWVTKGRSGPETTVAQGPAASPDTGSAAAPIAVEELEPAPPAPAEEIPVLPSPTPEPVPVQIVPQGAAPQPEPSRPVEPSEPRVEIQPRPAAPVEPRAEPRAPVAVPAEPRAAEPAPTAPTVSTAPAPPLLYVPPATGSEAAPPPSHTGPGTAPAATEPGLNGRTFVRELPVPGGGKLELRGIASGSQPAALINGRVLARGEVIEGFTVVGVESRRVELKGYGATVYLSLDQEQ